jgi:hypothetical protein
MIRAIALLFIGLCVVTAVVAEENLIFRGKELVIVDGPSENIPIVQPVTLKGPSEDTPMAEHAAEGAIHANRNDHLYYLPSCEGYSQVSSADVVPFVSEEIATESGYQRAENCS